MLNTSSKQSQGDSTTERLSRIRIAYAVSYGTVILGFIISAIAKQKNGEGPIDPALSPYIATGVGLLFVGMIFTMFIVRCGNCNTRVFSLMRPTRSRRSSQDRGNSGFSLGVHYSGEPWEIFGFMGKKKCPVCGIARK